LLLGFLEPIALKFQGLQALALAVEFRFEPIALVFGFAEGGFQLGDPIAQGLDLVA
jgi:hypothetical protein